MFPPRCHVYGNRRGKFRGPLGPSPLISLGDCGRLDAMEQTNRDRDFRIGFQRGFDSVLARS